MQLTEAIINLAQGLITPGNHWYRWPIIKDRLPEGITLPNGSLYYQNVSLKLQLNERWKNANDQEKLALVDYYIAEWGGIRNNKPEKIRSYALQSPDQLIALGKSGVASWSKALCIRDPNEYPIYDAHVSVALNALQAINNVVQPQLFPIVPGRNKLLKRAPARLRQYATQHHWPLLGAQDFYRWYIMVISKAAANLGVPLYTAEMLLFAKAEDLHKKAFPNDQFNKVPHTIPLESW